jgi:prepilin-type N-terminal cleavage/methylation domain-containing protein/prepilin-type processing-associated H-X9-DG protein
VSTASRPALAVELVLHYRIVFPITPMKQKLHPSIPAQSKRGFTLIELLVVIAIIGVLAGILVPAISGVRVSAHKAESVSQLKQIHAALGMYATEHKNTYPGPQGNQQDEDDTNDVIWAQRIAILGDYLGPRDKWMHQVLTAPGVKYEKPGGGYHGYKDTYNTYAVTGAMAKVNDAGYLDSFTGRKLVNIEDPARTPLVFLCQQRSAKDGHGVTFIKSGVHPLLKSDLSANAPGDTKVFNFDLGGVVPIVMADGHVEIVEFDRLKAFIENSQWEGRPTTY